MKLEGAKWIGSHLDLNDGSVTNLDKSSLIWTSKEVNDKQNSAALQQIQKVPLTVYLNADRSVSLFSISLFAVDGLKSSMIAKRAVALRAS